MRLRAVVMPPASDPPFQWFQTPSPSPSLSPSTISSPTSSPSSTSTTSSSTTSNHQSTISPPSKSPVDFSPPLIAMVVVVATAFLIVTYSRLISRHVVPPILQVLRYQHRRWKRWRRRRRARSYLASSAGDVEYMEPYDSPFFEQSDAFSAFSPYVLDESAIKTIPLSIYTAKNGQESRDCAVCLLEFEEDDYIRTLPFCSHKFHVDCIDIWLRSHANCPLCRAGIFRPESPFIPVMAARIRPSLDETILPSIFREPLAEAPLQSHTTVPEITPCIDESRNSNSEDRISRHEFLLKRSYSFGFERSLASERMVMEPSTASPWRYRRGSFWSKRPSPFGSLPKARVFSFRYYRGTKSPFLRRRGFFPLSESSVRFSMGSTGGGGGSSRRSKSMTSPMFLRSSGAVGFSSSRLRCGDPEALLSPERFNRR